MSAAITMPHQGRGKPVKTPVYIQMESLECGAACLGMVLAYCGCYVPLETLREECNINRDGVNAKILLKVAQAYGLNVRAIKCGVEALKEQGTFPCIIHWNFNHFVVLNGFKGDKAYLNDPAKGAYAVSMEEFERSFTGVCLLLEPNENFVPGGKPETLFSIVKRSLKGTGPAFLIVVLTTVITALVGIINPAFSRVFMDYLLTGLHPEWIMPLVYGMGTLLLVNLVLGIARTNSNLRINGRMAALGASSYFWHVLRVPMSFYSQRSVGDIQARQASNENIASTVVNTLAPLFLDAILLVLYLIVIVRYNPLLALIGIASTVVTLLLSRWTAKRQMEINRVQQRDSGLLSGSTVAGISMIETIKANGAETGFFGKWAGYQANVSVQAAKTAHERTYIGGLTSLVTSITNMAVLIVGVLLIIEGNFTAGALLAFQSYLNQFTAPATALIGAQSSLTIMRGEIERVDDVMRYREDDSLSNDVQDDKKAKLKGHIELKDVTFGYSRYTDPLIKNMNVDIAPGSKVAFVGFSGCGKSTVSKLLTGILQPQSGEILFDGKPMTAINRSVFSGSVAVVDQEILLFDDTIANNIKMFDESVEDFEMILAARDADIHDAIMQRPGGYQHRMRENGSDFSGGQRQRIEIARALAQDPTILILDEATSALDAATEEHVVKAIADRGLTCVVIAHRLSTIRDCDQIFVMDNGTIVDRGTHEELFARGGLYTQLVTND